MVFWLLCLWFLDCLFVFLKNGLDLIDIDFVFGGCVKVNDKITEELELLIKNNTTDLIKKSEIERLLYEKEKKKLWFDCWKW